MRLVLVALTLGLALPAFAQQAPVGRSAIDAELSRYYAQERATAKIAGGIGVVAACSGAYLLTRKNDFSRGLGIPLLVLGLLEGVGAPAYVDTVDREIAHYREALTGDPAAFKAEELAHLQGTTSRFRYYRAFELGLTAAGIGVGAYGLASKRDTWKGVGLGLASLGAPLLVIDTFNNASAERYVEGLGMFQPELAVEAREGGGGVALSGRF